MARPVPHPGNAQSVGALHEWAVKLTQNLRDRFAPQDTLPEVEPDPVFEISTGMMVLFPDYGSVPSGWIEAEGGVVLRADYPDLFTLIGTNFNTGGETGLQFRLPNYTVDIGHTAAKYRWIIKT